MDPMKSSNTMRRGFTLVELLIVVIILGILAAVVIPQFASSTEDGKTSTLTASLSTLRNAIERYYHQHGATYPGENRHSNGAPSATEGQARDAFINQLTLYSDAIGLTSATKSAVFKYGPYLKRSELPGNPFSELTTIRFDITETDISVAASDGSAGWKFYIKTGRLIANDGTHSAY